MHFLCAVCNILFLVCVTLYLVTDFVGILCMSFVTMSVTILLMCLAFEVHLAIQDNFRCLEWLHVALY